jgi:hypothetical protein
MATVHIRQWIYQLEGTDSVMTRLVITKLGLVVVEVSEVIHQDVLQLCSRAKGRGR